MLQNHAIYFISRNSRYTPGKLGKKCIIDTSCMGKRSKTKSGRGQVIIDFEIDAEMVFLVIKNIGQAPVFNLKIKPSAVIIGLEGKSDITKLSIFEEISYLAPGKEIKIFVDVYESFFRNLKDWLISFTLNYEDERDKRYKSKITHNLEIYSDLVFFIKKS
jgi:hypothetical protein